MAARKKVSKGRSTKKTAPAKAKAKPKAATPKAAAKRKATAKPKPAKRKVAAKAKVKPASKKVKRSAPARRPAAKPAARAASTPPAPAKKKATLVTRRDATGHLNPKYSADLRALSHEYEDRSTDNAFLRKPRSHDTLAEELGEDAVATMTSGEDQSERMQNQEVEEDNGGPFVTTSGREEFAGGTDKSNPRSATREPFPTS